MNSVFIFIYKALKIVLPVLAFFIIFLNIIYIRYNVKEKEKGTTLEEYAGAFWSKKKVIIICEIIFILY